MGVNKMNPKTILKYFAGIVLAIGVIWLIVGIMLQNFAGAGIGLLISIVGIGVFIVIKKYA